MNHRKLALALMLATAASAQAHTHLEGSVPADKSRVAAPAAIELQFSEAARLTALSLQKGSEAVRPLQPLPAKAATRLSVPAPALSAGDYVVNWRVVSADGHVMSGKFAFTVDPGAAAARPSSRDKDIQMHHDHVKPATATPEQHKH